jgi:hypothetical protein
MIAELPKVSSFATELRLRKRLAVQPGTSAAGAAREVALSRALPVQGPSVSASAFRDRALMVKAPTFRDARRAAYAPTGPRVSGPRQAPEIQPGAARVPEAESSAFVDASPPQVVEVVPDYPSGGGGAFSEETSPELERLTLPTADEVKTAAASVPQWVWIAAGVVVVGGVAALLFGGSK